MSFSGKPTTFVEQAIENDGFWPDLSVTEFQKGYRLPAEYLVEMLAADLTMAMVEVNTDLAKLKARWQGAGVSNVESADTTMLDNDLADVDIKLQFTEAQYLAEDPAGEIEAFGNTWSFVPFELWVAESGEVTGHGL
ncbi:Prophage PSPPH06, putative head completion/stabilization protein [Pseudomonas savastanoi pv. phaseolicola]|uniref:head completion/stabilization protein n=1 Tax=Pseudomonas savastanoi TaxID=29438 RepID=UPI000EFF41E1|nr:head completion/stabilization protein [Pseudomonas savastanoi]RMV40147.1 Prophage PSPPH06, putative head completion/stabilization protein [Pseudomonas savastanoi pv. phaseolicola]